MTVQQHSPADQSAFAELSRQLVHYQRQKAQWLYWHYGTKVVILVLGATIPVLTTVDAWPWLIASVGGTIAVVEGMSQLWHFHDRYLAARIIYRGLDRQRILYDSGSDPYADERTRDSQLATQIARLFDSYEAQVLSSLKTSITAADRLTPA
jgi:hypothetical protein